MWAEEMTGNKAEFVQMSHKSQQKRVNAVEVNGFSLGFLSFSLAKKRSTRKASLRENKALILHTALSKAEDSSQ